MLSGKDSFKLKGDLLASDPDYRVRAAQPRSTVTNRGVDCAIKDAFRVSMSVSDQAEHVQLLRDRYTIVFLSDTFTKGKYWFNKSNSLVFNPQGE